VVEVSGVSKTELFNRLEYWFNNYYKNASTVIELKDENAGTIRGKHRVDLFTTMPTGQKVKKGLEYYSINVMVRDGRFKYTIDDIFFHNVPKIPLENWLGEKASANEKEWVAQTHKFISELIEDLKKTLKQPIPQSKEDN